MQESGGERVAEYWGGMERLAVVQTGGKISFCEQA